jgi:hypothetical protein
MKSTCASFGVGVRPQLRISVGHQYQGRLTADESISTRQWSLTMHRRCRLQQHRVPHTLECA